MRRTRRSRHARRPYRVPRIEWLEPRIVLAAPTLAALGDVNLLAGAPLHVALDGFDADGDTLTYEVSVSNVQLTNPGVANPVLSTVVPEGNRSMKISVQGFGDMLFELFEQRAPRTTSRIIELAESGFYDGLTFHRILENFMIQGGDPWGTGAGGSGFDFDDEFHPDLQHTSGGLLSMAKSWDDTNDSQFFITAVPTRHLDFNHSVFGFLTEGEDVRQDIAAVEVEPQEEPSAENPNPEVSKPVDPVVMTSVTIVQDVQNAVLMLKAPEGTTGQADVTVTVHDGHQGVAQRTFHVTVQPDSTNGYPVLVSDIPPFETTVDTPVEFQIHAADVEGDSSFFYGAWDLADWPLTANWSSERNPYLEVDVDPATGHGIITPSDGFVGVGGVLLGVNSFLAKDEAVTDPRSLSSYWDFQFVPVYVTPDAPTSIELLTHAPDQSQLTHLNNTTGNELQFRVYGLAQGATVRLYADGHLIGQATAQSSSAVVTTNGTFELSDGSHTVTAIQALLNEDVTVGNLDDTVDLVSETSSPLEITVDSALPEFTSNPVTQAWEGRPYAYDVQTAQEPSGDVAYHLETAPLGMTIDPDTGMITWRPDNDQAGTRPVLVGATSTAGSVAWQNFQITVFEGPGLEPIGPKTVDEGSTVTFTAHALGGEAPVFYTLDPGAPTGAQIHGVTGEFTWQTDEPDGPGQYPVTVRVTDQNGASNYETVTVTVVELNEPPVLEPIEDRTGDQSIDEGQTLEFDAVATDSDEPANTLTFSLAPGSPEGASIHPTSGRFTWTPNESQGGRDFTVTVRVSDGWAAAVEQSFDVTVGEVNNSPVFDPVDPPTAVPGERYRLAVTARDADDAANANPVVYRLDSGPEGARIDAATGEITWDVPNNFLDGHDPDEPVQFTVRATEDVPAGEEALSTTLTIEVQVTDLRALALFALEQGLPVSNPPAASPDAEAAKRLETLAAGLAGLLADSTAPTQAGAAGPTSGFLATSDLMGNPAVFGFQLGAGTGYGGTKLPEFEIELEPLPQLDLENQEADEEPPSDQGEEEARQTDPSADREVAQASDAAIESLVASGDLDQEAEPEQESRSGAGEPEGESPELPQSEQVAKA